MIHRIFLLKILIFFIPLTIISQEGKKLSKKEANEEVKRLTILTKNLTTEKEELNEKLMSEYEKLLSEMDDNSNLRKENGELRTEIRDMQKELLDIQKLIQKKDNTIEKINTSIENYLIKTSNDSLLISSLKLTNQNFSIKIDSLNQINNSKSFFEETIIDVHEECHEMDWYCYYVFCTEDYKECLKFDDGDFRGNTYHNLPEIKSGDNFKIIYTIENVEYLDPYELEVNHKEVLITEKIPVLVYIKKL